MSNGIFAQEKETKHELGLKFETPYSRLSPGLTYQYHFSPKFRLSTELEYRGYKLSTGGWKYGNVGIDIQRLWQMNNGVNFYVGLGANYGLAQNYYLGNKTFHQTLSFVPQLGVEYDFNRFGIPLILGTYTKVHYQRWLESPGYGRTTFNLGFNLKYSF